MGSAAPSMVVADEQPATTRHPMIAAPATRRRRAEGTVRSLPDVRFTEETPAVRCASPLDPAGMVNRLSVRSRPGVPSTGCGCRSGRDSAFVVAAAPILRFGWPPASPAGQDVASGIVANEGNHDGEGTTGRDHRGGARRHQRRLLPARGGLHRHHRARAPGRRGRHLAAQPLPGSGLRRVEPRLLLHVQPQPGLDPLLRHPARDPGLHPQDRHRSRPVALHPPEHRGRLGPLGRRQLHLDRDDGRR